MPARLAIYSPYIGAPSETFVRRHVCDLLPGDTAVIAEQYYEPWFWDFNGPKLVLGTAQALAHPSIWTRATRRAGRALGLSQADPRQALVERFLGTHGVKVMMGEYLEPGLQWLDVAARCGIRFYGRALGYDVSACLRSEEIRRDYLRYNGAAGIISNSEIGAKRLVDIGVDASKVHVVPCGVVVPGEFRPRSERRSIRCVAVGRMVAKKAPIILLDSFRRALDWVPGMRLDYIGGGQLLPAARQFVDALGLTQEVKLHGYLPTEDVARLLEEADVFLQHSTVDPDTGDEEGLPVAILEAMARGLPVVSTVHAGIPEAVIDGETGYLVPEGDSIAMAERIVTLAEDGELRATMSRAGWARARDLFTWERERVELLEIMGLGARSNGRLATGAVSSGNGRDRE